MSPLSTPTTETVHVVTRTVHCDGGSGISGHPLIYMEIGSENAVTCPYCSRQFIFNGTTTLSH